MSVTPFAHNGPTGDSAARRVSVLAAASLVLRRRRWFAIGALTGALIGLMVAGLRPAAYTATASFLPQSGNTSNVASDLGALGGAIALPVNLGGFGDSPDFYVELIRSRAVLERVASDSFRIGGHAAPLADVLDLDGTREQRLDGAIRWLDDALHIGTRRGIVRLSVSTRHPALSRDLLQKVILHTGEFNVDKRQARAAAERKFTETRLAVAKAELSRAEAAMQDFQRGNRSYRPGAELSFVHDRLEREISMRQQVYTTLMQQHEQARIEEVRNTPLITVLDEPNLPADADPRHALFAVLAGVARGLSVAALAAFLSMDGVPSRPAVGDDSMMPGTRLSTPVAAGKLKKLS